MEDSIRSHNEEELMKLKPGDLIRFWNESDEHWAVYDGEDEKGEQIIHWWMGNGVDSSPRIKSDSFWTCAENMEAGKENSNCIEGVKVVERTKDFMQKLEQEENKEDKAYPDLFYSSEHFAKWCHYGLGGLDSKWGPPAPALVIDISRVKNVVEFVEGIFTNHTYDGKAIRHNVDVLRQLQPGDIVSFSRGSYKHWATYIGQDKDKKSIIHWWDNDGATDPYIRIVPFWDLAQNCTAEKINADLPDNVTVVESEAVKRAEALINMSELAQIGQELIVKADMFHCSEDFAKWFYLKLMGNAGSTESVERHTEELSFKRHNFIWKCCEHDIVDHLGKGRHLLNEEVLLTLEYDKFSQLLVEILKEIKLESLKDLECLRLEEIQLSLERHNVYDSELLDKLCCSGLRLEEIQLSLERHDVYDLELLDEIRCSVERFDKLPSFIGENPMLYKHMFQQILPKPGLRIEEIQSFLECQKEYDSELLDEIRCSVKKLKEGPMPGKEPNKEILHIVEIISGIEWHFLRRTRKHCKEPDMRTLQLDPCSIFRRRKDFEVLKKLKPGDIIKYVKNSWNHWGVYIGLKYDVHYVIHWTADEHVTEPNSSCIENEFLFEYGKAEKLEKVNDDRLEDTIINGAEVVERVQAFDAKISAGKKSKEDFSDLFNDCEHFAKWCRYGLGLKSLKISKEQIKKIKDIRNFVKGDFSVIPWQIDSYEDIPVSQMGQLKKSEADISSSLRK